MRARDDSNDDGLGAMERSAAEWVLRMGQGLSPDEERDLARWLAEDPRHGRILREMEQTSRLLDGIKFRIPHEADQAQAVEPEPAPRRRWLRVTAAAATCLIVGLGVWRIDVERALHYSTEAITRVGESRRLQLPDGSVIVMNTATHVEVEYGRRERIIKLESGEAYFAVAKNPQRPFIVQSGRIAVRAVGTAFDVRLHADALSVLVTEGKVWVNDEGAKDAGRTEPVLGVGHAARVPLDLDSRPDAPGIVVTAVKPLAMADALAWQKCRLEFSDTPLSQVVEEFNRYNDRKIVIADSSLASLRFGGSFGFHGIDSFLELLEQNFNVVADRRGNEIVLRLARQAG